MTAVTCPSCGHTFSTDDDEWSRALREDVRITGDGRETLRISAPVIEREGTDDDETMRGSIGVTN